MWILTFFPDLLVHLIVALGALLFLAATFLGMFPIVNTYKTPAQIVGVIILLWGLYLEGGLAYKDKLAIEVAELETKLAKAETKGAEKNTEIVTKIVKDTKVIRQKGDDVIKYIDREIVKYDDQCIIPLEVIQAHNRAATLTSDPVTPTVTEEKKDGKMLLPARTSK
jgi:hypothetical protein